MEGLRFHLLGGLEILLDGLDVAPAVPRKAALLLAFLAMTGRPHSRPFLANLLWGESPDASARLSLRTALWSLGGRLAGCLEAGRHQVALRPGAFSADALDFTRLAGRDWTGRTGEGSGCHGRSWPPSPTAGAPPCSRPPTCTAASFWPAGPPTARRPSRTG